MTFQTIGKKENPAVLLLGGAGMDSAALGSLLAPLTKDYCLLLPAAAFCTADALEETLREDYAGRIWGAYALREGGEVLAALLARGTVRVRTAVLDGTLLPDIPAGLVSSPSQLIYWTGSKDGAAKKCCKALRAAIPSLKTVTLKKLGAAQFFLTLRPDLAAKRLAKSFGKAKTVSLTALLPAGERRVWSLLPQRRDASFLTERDEAVADEQNRVYITGGRGKLVKFWSRLTRLEELEPGATLCTEQIELAAGPLSGAASLWAKRYLRRDLRRSKRALRRQK